MVSQWSAARPQALRVTSGRLLRLLQAAGGVVPSCGVSTFAAFIRYWLMIVSYNATHSYIKKNTLVFFGVIQ